MSQTYRIDARGSEQGVWLTLTHVEASSFEGSVRKVRASPKAAEFASWAWWRSVVVSNKSGRRLGYTKEFHFPPPASMFT